MKTKLTLTALTLFLYACASGNTADTLSIPEKVTQTQNRLEQMNTAADNAFDDLDCSLNGTCPPPVPQPSGNKEYERQQAAANDAFKELDCEIADGENCSLPPEKPVEEKARPGSTMAEKTLDRGISKYPMVNGYPIWFSQPGYDGYLGGVGMAKPQKAGYAAQRRVATVQAQADLARSVKVNIYNEYTTERLLVSKDTQEYYQEKFSVLSRQQADEFISTPQTMDEWLDEKTGDLYIWVVLPK